MEEGSGKCEISGEGCTLQTLAQYMEVTTGELYIYICIYKSCVFFLSDETVRYSFNCGEEK